MFDTISIILNALNLKKTETKPSEGLACPFPGK